MDLLPLKSSSQQLLMKYIKIMNSLKRNLLVFQSKESKTDFFRELTPCQWLLHFAHSPDEAFEPIGKYHILVGLCIVDVCDDQSYWKQIVRLFNRTPKINWILALPKECMFESSIFSKKSRLIAQYCYDYLILPVDPQRLLFSIRSRLRYGRTVQKSVPGINRIS